MNKPIVMALLLAAGSLSAQQSGATISVVGDSNSSSPNVFASPETVNTAWPVQLEAVYNGSFAGATVWQAGSTINARYNQIGGAQAQEILVTGVGINSINLESYGGQGLSAAQMIADFEDPLKGVLTVARREGVRLIVVDLPGPMAGSALADEWDEDGTRDTQLNLWNQYLYDLEANGEIEVIRANSELCINNRITKGAPNIDYAGNALHYNQNAHDWIAAAIIEIVTAPRIDVTPTVADNRIKPASDNPIVVAVHSTNTATGDAVDFDALQVNPVTLRFGSGGAPNVAVPWVVDADLDGEFNDVLFVFKTQASGVLCGDTSVSLSGETYAGVQFKSSDFIQTDDCIDMGCHP